MSIYHCSIKIISRSGGRSAVASAAYRAGEKLHNDETGITHDFTKKGGIVYTEIMLPSNAPEEYRNRELLWNDVQRQEKRSDAQLAREVEVALPVELTREQQIEVLHSFIRKNFVDEGMIADFAIHDKEDGNPHAHIMLTTRGFTVDRKWEKKQRSVFANARDEQGRAIYDPALPSYDPKDKEHTSQYRIPVLDADGNQKTRIRKGKGTEYLWEKITVPVNDWNDQNKAEQWRSSWAEECNRFLKPDQQIDHRSYERQGVDLEPTVHEGVTARQMEETGSISDRCEENRGIKRRNSLRIALGQKIENMITEFLDFIARKERDLIERIRTITEYTYSDREAGRTDPADGRSEGQERQPGIGEQSDDDREYVPIIREFFSKGITGKSSEGERKPGERCSDFAGTAERIDELERLARSTAAAAERTERNIEQTDRAIEKADQWIAQLIRNRRQRQQQRRGQDFDR